MTNNTTRLISLDNGNSYHNAADLDDNTITMYWDRLVQMMDDDSREQAHSAVAPCSNRDFLAEYLRIAPDDLVIG